MNLEENSLAMAAGVAAHSLGAGQRRVAGDVLEYLCELPSAVVHHVPVHAIVVGDLLQFSDSVSDNVHPELIASGEG